MCQSLRVSGRSVMDMGAGDGQFMISALANGARNVLGCEHPQNHAQLFIFRSVLEGMAQVLDGFEIDQIASKVEFMLHDIDPFWAVEGHARFSGNFSRSRIRILGGDVA